MSEKSWICQSLRYYHSNHYFDPHVVFNYSKYGHYKYYSILTVALMMTTIMMIFTIPTLGGNNMIPNNGSISI